MSEDLNFDSESTFYVGDWLVDPSTCRISRNGDEHKIEPKAMTVLVCLAQKQGQVISREALEEGIESRDGDAMINITVENYFQYWILFTRAVTVVEGDVIQLDK